MPETIIPVTEKYLLSVMRKVTQSHRSLRSPGSDPFSVGQARAAGAAAAQLSAGMISAP
jgi:hypothetical protein